MVMPFSLTFMPAPLGQLLLIKWDDFPTRRGRNSDYKSFTVTTIIIITVVIIIIILIVSSPLTFLPDMTYEVDWALKANYLLTCSLTTNFNLCHLTEKPLFFLNVIYCRRNRYENELAVVTQLFGRSLLDSICLCDEICWKISDCFVHTEENWEDTLTLRGLLACAAWYACCAVNVIVFKSSQNTSFTPHVAIQFNYN